MYGFVWLIDQILSIYEWLLIASVVLSWLVNFNVINRNNRFVHQVGEFLFRITEPVLRPIRNLLPNMGGIDISPIIVILLIGFIRLELPQLLLIGG